MLLPNAKLRRVGTLVRIAVVVTVLVAGGCLAARFIGRLRHRKPSSYAVIYGRLRYVEKTNADDLDIYWQLLPSERPRVVYTIPGRAYSIENSGYMPSPDGRWLYVWRERVDEYGQSVSSEFLVLHLPDGKVIPVAEVNGKRFGYDTYVMKLVPRWLDSHRLALESDAGSTVFDVARNKLTAPLPPWPPKTRPSESLLDYAYTNLPKPEEYVRQHYRDELTALQQAVHVLARPMRLGDYLDSRDYPGTDTIEAMFARSLGIGPVSRSEVGMKRAWPQLVCSPDRKYVARAGVFLADSCTVGGDSECNADRCGRDIEARVDIFDVRARKSVWDAGFLWEGRWRGGRPFRAIAMPELRGPHFADLRWSPDGRFFSYGVYEIPCPPGVPDIRQIEGSTRVQGRAGMGFSHEAVVIQDVGWIGDRSNAHYRSPSPYAFVYYIPDAYNAFVVPAAPER